MPNARKIVENTRSVTIGSLLSDDKLKAIVDILNKPGLSDYETAQALKAYLKQFEAELEAQGVVSDYLAYWFVANAAEFRRQRAALN